MMKKKFSFKLGISFQISVFLILVAFIPIVVMMALNTYEKQQLSMMENSNVQQGRIMAAALAGESVSPERTLEILENMRGQFDCRIRVLDEKGKLVCDSAVLGDVVSSEVMSVDVYDETNETANTSFFYRLFSYPIRLYRRYFRPPARYYFGNADFYTDTDVFTGQEVYEALEGRYGARTRISSGDQVSVTLYSALPIFSSVKTDEVVGVVLVSRSTYRILQNLYELRLDLAKIFFYSLIAVLVVAIFLAFRISFPLKKLSRQTTECADRKGHIIFTSFTGRNRRDEIGNLSRSFTVLIERLNRRIKFSQAFSSDISHEFKNPLAAIRTSAEVLSDPELDAGDREELSNAIVGEVDYLQTLLNGVRNISKIDAGNAFDDSALPLLPVNEYIRTVVSKMQKKYPDVEFDFSSMDENLMVRIPEDYIYRIAENLIENAAGFGSKVSVSTGVRQDKKNSCFVFRVEDNGVGISDESKGKIFDRFYSERKEADKQNHTGLGLSIVKAIVDSLEGNIDVGSSETLGGCSFTITINNIFLQ